MVRSTTESAFGTPFRRQARLAPALPRGARVQSVVASRDHLLFCLGNTLVALRLEDGRLERVHPIPRPGNLALANELIFLANGSLHAYAPAERTFLLAGDSPRAEAYRKPEEPAPPGESAPASLDTLPAPPPRRPRAGG